MSEASVQCSAVQCSAPGGHSIYSYDGDVVLVGHVIVFLVDFYIGDSEFLLVSCLPFLVKVELAKEHFELRLVVPGQI